MTNKKIYVIKEEQGYDSEGYHISNSSVIEAFEYEDDAKLALWYWYLDQCDKDADTEWDEMVVYSEGDNCMTTTLDRYIFEINLYGG